MGFSWGAGPAWQWGTCRRSRVSSPGAGSRVTVHMPKQNQKERVSAASGEARMAVDELPGPQEPLQSAVRREQPGGLSLR